MNFIFGSSVCTIAESSTFIPYLRNINIPNLPNLAPKPAFHSLEIQLESPINMSPQYSKLEEEEYTLSKHKKLKKLCFIALINEVYCWDQQHLIL